jgi:signal transduction histidine kinase
MKTHGPSPSATAASGARKGFRFGATSVLVMGLLVMLAWTLTIGGLLAWNLGTIRTHAEALARKEARANFNKDLALRHWATSHGGVYVPLTERTPANPGLSHLPERDIETPSGKRLTLMNPAYMLRQIMQDYADDYGVKGKITSSRPINPINAPDDWEAAALRQFEQGVEEVFAFVEQPDGAKLRLMRPMVTRRGCLKCHGFQGYEVGDIRGGVGVTVDMAPYLRVMSETRWGQWLAFAIIWLLGLVVIGILIWLLRIRMVEQSHYERQLSQRGAELARSNADLQQFAEVAAHHLQEPARRLVSFAERLRQQLDGKLDVGDARLSLKFIDEQARHQQGLLHDIELFLAADCPRAAVMLTDAALVVAAVLERMPATDDHAGVEFRVADLPSAWIDSPRLADLFSLALDNALHHARGGGQAAGMDDRPLRIGVGGERRGQRVRYWVTDNGQGIEPAYRERVFRVLERLGHGKGAQGGTGIGLAIVRRIVESCGGSAWIEDAPEGGCCLMFELPAEKPL